MYTSEEKKIIEKEEINENWLKIILKLWGNLYLYSTLCNSVYILFLELLHSKLSQQIN